MFIIRWFLTCITYFKHWSQDDNSGKLSLDFSLQEYSTLVWDNGKWNGDFPLGVGLGHLLLNELLQGELSGVLFSKLRGFFFKVVLGIQVRIRVDPRTLKGGKKNE